MKGRTSLWITPIVYGMPISAIGKIGRETVEIESSVLNVLYVLGLKSPTNCIINK